ncbi:hypothetical protein ACQEUU_17855 [Nonomuraea sp. CA-218870]|uniref:hypothetical protein n=1 Tax=Nonomuraea sp. CA-218870 TaxID=3239998 RepID=UPI003D8A2F87
MAFDDDGVLSSAGQRRGLYRLLAQAVPADTDEPPPDTTLTRQIETVDNDRAIIAWVGAGIALP